jgi:NADPH-dependent 2,4-dienoyl-CoA reductase/sulfur reductase-like enzyme
VLFTPTQVANVSSRHDWSLFILPQQRCAVLKNALLKIVDCIKNLLYIPPAMPVPLVRHSEVDVLIVGAGPAGLMCANALANARLNVRIVDQRSVHGSVPSILAFNLTFR